MNAQMVYGGAIFMPIGNGSGYYINRRVEKSQLPLFAHRHDMISNGLSYWLREVVSDKTFSKVHENGIADTSYSSYVLGVRPYFCIG